jgi:hypothetical protein
MSQFWAGSGLQGDRHRDCVYRNRSCCRLLAFELHFVRYPVASDGRTTSDGADYKAVPIARSSEQNSHHSSSVK